MALRRHRASDKINRRGGSAHDQPTGGRDRAGGEAERAQRVITEALRMLAIRPRAESQLRERLMSKAWTSKRLVDQCILRLREMGYIDDDRFAENYASHRLATRSVGRARLARELALKKVDRKTIERALERVFESESEKALIDRAVQKWVRTHGRPADRRDVRRMFDHLARLGFEYDLMIRKLDALRKEVSDYKAEAEL